MSATLEHGTRVTLNFAVSLQDGAVVDSNFDAAPVSFALGDGSLLPAFEACLNQAPIGEKCRFEVAPEHAFGQPNPNNVQRIPRDSFDPAMVLEPGLVCSFADAAGGELPGVIESVGEDEVSVDFNHPLAGHTIIFEVLVHQMEPPEAS